MVEKEKLNDLMISYEKKYSLNKETWWPIKLYFGGKKYYPYSNEKYLENKNTKIIRYFYVNHRISKDNKKLIFGKYKCNGKIEFYRDTGEFFLVTSHNELCDKKSNV